MLTSLAAFAAERIDVSRRSLQQYEIAIGQYVSHAGDAAPSADSLRAFLRDVRERTSARTANNKRQAVLTVWKWALQHGHDLPPLPEIPRFRDAKRAPVAYTVDEVSRLLVGCRQSAPVAHGAWTGRHWSALVLTLYDTALRIGAVLEAERTHLVDGVLTIPGELQKHGRDTRHRLHPQTLGAIGALPSTRKLFDWPLHRRSIWIHFRELLRDAGLPCGRRDLFHRLRRTSYSYVAKELGVDAAGSHAGHAGDLSAVYLDRSILGLPDAVDVLPRPA